MGEATTVVVKNFLVTEAKMGPAVTVTREDRCIWVQTMGALDRIPTAKDAVQAKRLALALRSAADQVEQFALEIFPFES